ncbi:DUF2087 domain-containing protein [Bacillus sp. sid0103]|uniref:DUF2087 domain-containing protein n=1 Tax=Bacillus sp. sid0103 TaxID=2856337 RepID=UPI001C43EC0B|nr:DUF2087 domain-containing protein [Bacillus sp. sid0103]MBV7508672.1 DUF2087 domain-containing protein [Bacillus sp. sid0103]
MELSEIFWNASIEELKRGYTEDADSFICLLCGKKLEKGIIYPLEDILYEAERFIRVHIEVTHHSVFESLMELDKKFTGLTEHQNQLLHLFFQGKNDTEVQKEMGIGSTSTIRHHRFALKEKERQAKIFLTMMELLKEKDKHAPAFVPVHKTAKMLDERYNITEDEQTEIVKKYFPGELEGRLKKFPLREKEKLVILRKIVEHVKCERTYDEKELNQLLLTFYDDYALLRRYLIEYGFLDRKADGSQYWLKK